MWSKLIFFGFLAVCQAQITSTESVGVALFRCADNETYTDCHNPCSELKCSRNEAAVSCLMMCMQGCACKSGYLRNDQGECVESKDCGLIAKSHSHSANCSCPRGYHCSTQSGRSRCVQNQTCRNVRCGNRSECAMVEPSRCYGSNCAAQPTCIQSNPCDRKRCSGRTECVLKQETCRRGPCRSIVAECVSKRSLDK
ncbi:unnamed protein product [Caenorhabditis angaria]|uniref:TIL domain-containing protein n=1 Tax=Caenorhabditis angaria TaxID=860376 RepID=A0A9P1J035_9PELO|nr:unnamed protein product [Caenorhabditis angaria]